jgi:hypothetical protein
VASGLHFFFPDFIDFGSLAQHVIWPSIHEMDDEVRSSRLGVFRTRSNKSEPLSRLITLDKSKFSPNLLAPCAMAFCLVKVA